MWQEKQIEMLNRIPHYSWADLFFSKFFYVDTGAFVLLAICFVWKIIDPKIGLRFFYLMTLSFVVNALAKLFFEMPRPCQIDPSSALTCLSNYGFPSGAAQSSAIYFGITWLETKKRVYRIAVFIFASLLCFSRLYLKVHFFTDILGGLCIGALLVAFYRYGFPHFQKQWKFWSLIFPPLICLLSPSLFFSSALLSLGIAICLIAREAKKISPILSNYRSLPFIVSAGFLFLSLFFSSKLPLISFFFTCLLSGCLVLYRSSEKQSRV